MNHRVDYGFEDRSLAELGNVAAGRLLSGRDAPVADHEPHRISYLLVERAADVQRVELAIAVHLCAVVADGLDVGVREPFARVIGGEQDSADRGAQRSVSVVLDELQLRQDDLGGIVGARARVASPQIRTEGVHAGVGDDLRIGGGGVRLPSRLQ